MDLPSFGCMSSPYCECENSEFQQSEHPSTWRLFAQPHAVYGERYHLPQVYASDIHGLNDNLEAAIGYPALCGSSKEVAPSDDFLDEGTASPLIRDMQMCAASDA